MSSALELLQAEFAGFLAGQPASQEFSGALLPRDARLPERLALYRGNVASACRDALGAAFPVLRKLVGDEFFELLAHAYSDAHPSRSGDLNAFGTRMADFLAGFEPVDSLPYVADVAALEWAVHRAYRAADADPLRRERIAALQPEELLAARFTLHPACSWLVSPHPIASIWLAHQPRSKLALPASLQQHEFVLVTRPRWRVEVLAVSAGELVALDALRAGMSMDATIGTALRTDRDFNFAKAFVRWLDYNVLVGLEESCTLLDS